MLRHLGWLTEPLWTSFLFSVNESGQAKRLFKVLSHGIKFCISNWRLGLWFEEDFIWWGLLSPHMTGPALECHPKILPKAVGFFCLGIHPALGFWGVLDQGECPHQCAHSDGSCRNVVEKILTYWTWLEGAVAKTPLLALRLSLGLVEATVQVSTSSVKQSTSPSPEIVFFYLVCMCACVTQLADILQ